MRFYNDSGSRCKLRLREKCYRNKNYYYSIMKPKTPLTKKQKILKYLLRIIKSYWITPIVLLIYIILSIFIDFSLNAISYRIISTFCSIIIGFGINSFYSILKIEKDTFWKPIYAESQRFMLNLIKRCVYLAFGILFFSILVVSSSELFPKIYDFFIIATIGYIFNLVVLYFRNYADTLEALEYFKEV